MIDKALSQRITAFRQFNRFHTRLIGVLNEELLASKYSLIQVRILYELANRKGLAAADLAEALKLDRGYLSRMLATLETYDLICRTPDINNAKRMVLSLTSTGLQTFNELNDASIDEVAKLLAPLSEAQQRQLIGSMERIEQLLDGKTDNPMFVLRSPEIGDMGWITHRQGVLYAQEYSWDWTYEALVGKILSEFVENYDPLFERCWVAERDGNIIGSIFVVRLDQETAKLRLLYVEPSARGLGLGRRLVDECIRFSRAKNYKRMTLWTNSVLTSARTIYQAAGFELVEETAHHSFGQDLVGQTWSLDLC